MDSGFSISDTPNGQNKTIENVQKHQLHVDG